jgi:hypothetical protein
VVTAEEEVEAVRTAVALVESAGFDREVQRV